MRKFWKDYKVNLRKKMRSPNKGSFLFFYSRLKPYEGYRNPY